MNECGMGQSGGGFRRPLYVVRLASLLIQTADMQRYMVVMRCSDRRINFNRGTIAKKRQYPCHIILFLSATSPGYIRY